MRVGLLLLFVSGVVYGGFNEDVVDQEKLREEREERKRLLDEALGGGPSSSVEEPGSAERVMASPGSTSSSSGTSPTSLVLTKRGSRWHLSNFKLELGSIYIYIMGNFERGMPGHPPLMFERLKRGCLVSLQVFEMCL